MLNLKLIAIILLSFFAGGVTGSFTALEMWHNQQRQRAVAIQQGGAAMVNGDDVKKLQDFKDR